MNRPELDAFSRQHRLEPPAIALALRLTGLRPDAAAWRAFAASLLRATGIGALGAGLLLFVAANWQDDGVLGRFVLLQTALLLCIGVAIWRAPPALGGQGALILATLLTGGLLALFGQSYQTGADVYELFLTWAALALPFALAGRSGALWAVWWAVLNAGLALLCGMTDPDHFFWRLLDGWELDRSTTLMLPCLVDLLGAGAFLWLRGTRVVQSAPLWLVRCLASGGFVYGTLAMTTIVIGTHRFGAADGTAGAHVMVVLSFVALSAGIGWATWKARRDVFALALVATAWIAISTVWLARSTRFDDIGSFFLLAFWLIATSTAAGMVLMHWVRAWQVAPGVAVAGSAA